jgi:putative PIN family toxin of toxin-antitoxin system
VQKIILDTNIIISALIQRSYPYLILQNLVFEKLVDLCISDELFKEYIDVINRPKFNRYPDFQSKSELVLIQVLELGIKYKPIDKFEIIEDVDDNKILELAVEAKADFIITGNTNDFTFSMFRGTKIVTPAVYWEQHKPMKF